MPSKAGWKAADGDYGPGWYDVYDGLKRLSSVAGLELRLGIETVTGKGGSWGLRAVVRSSDIPHELGAGGYGKAYVDGAKTFSAACWRAVFAAEIELERLGFVHRSDEYHGAREG